MKKFLNFYTLLLASALVFAFSVANASALPPSISEIIVQLVEIEEGFENNKWQEAMEATEKIEKEVGVMLEQTKLQDELLVTLLSNLKNEIKMNNQEKAAVNYLRFQKRFFSFINNFEIEVHPLFSLLEKYVVDEAVEALEKGDYDNVAREMAEAGNLIKYIEPIFLEKGIKKEELKDFTSKIINVIQASKERDKTKVSEDLKQVQELYKSFKSRAM
jgi:hypothetical protein